MAARVEVVGRATGAGVEREELRVAPGLGATLVDADRQVLIQADAEAQLHAILAEFASRHFDIESLLLAHCEKVQDYVSRDLLVGIQQSEESHIDWLEEQIGLLEKVGLQNYLQSLMGAPA